MAVPPGPTLAGANRPEKRLLPDAVGRFACQPRAIHGSALFPNFGRISKKDATMSNEGTPAPQPQGGNPGMPNLQVVGQYIKDLSFENPGATASIADRPAIELAVDLNAARLAEQDMFEVELKIRVDAKNDGKPLFLLEVAYAGIFRLSNVTDTATQQMILLIQAPHMLFPFVRRIVSDVVRDGGMPPLMIEPIDFMQLYQARVAQATTAPQGTA
jgi:preprotein translocase subunit SecB